MQSKGGEMPKGGDAMITAKCSMHVGKKWNRAHNLRQYDREKWNRDGHIDAGRTAQNITLTDTPLERFFDAVFGDALVRFNEQNLAKHPDRLIGFRKAAEYQKASHKMRRERAVKAYQTEQAKSVREVIFQLGDHEEYIQLVQLVGQQKADEIHSAYLTEVYHKFVKDNPTLRVFSAVIHMDETKEGTPHLQLDFLPVTESNRGLTKKVSLEGAFKPLGFRREKQQKYAETPYKQWLADRRAGFEDFAQEFCNERKLGIVILPSEKSSVPHEQPTSWKARQSRVKASQGKVAALIGKDKKTQLEAAEYTISNAEAVAEGIAQEAAEKRKHADQDMTAARKISSSARAYQQMVDEVRQKALRAIADNRKKAAELDEIIAQRVQQALAVQEQRVHDLEAENHALKRQIQREARMPEGGRHEAE